MLFWVILLFFWPVDVDFERSRLICYSSLLSSVLIRFTVIETLFNCYFFNDYFLCLLRLLSACTLFSLLSFLYFFGLLGFLVSAKVRESLPGESMASEMLI